LRFTVALAAACGVCFTCR